MKCIAGPVLRLRVTGVLLAVATACGTGEGCDSCASKKNEKAAKNPSGTVADDLEDHADEGECVDTKDCEVEEPCAAQTCVDGRCEVTFSAQGTSCDDDTVCNGVATCNGRGECVPGAPPPMDDDNECTTDSCDPVRGVVHEPIPVDDDDECTIDECDPRTGTIAHTSIDADDGDDCTYDRCDPKTGVHHEPLKTHYTCDPTCGDGFHSASRRLSRACGPDRDALQTFCSPDCGDSFYTCDTRCPDRYEKRSATASAQCPPQEVSLFCVKK